MNNSTIPKIIHLCWFSGDKYPYVINKCIKSWKRVLPDYKIKIWDYDMAKSLDIPFINEALSVRKWAFAADVIRLYALYTEGGIYMDSDVFVKRKFDHILEHPLVFFIENHSREEQDINLISIQAAFFAAQKSNKFINEVLDYYRSERFIKEDGSFHIDPIAPYIYAKQAEKIGFKYEDKEQILGEDVVILPSRFVAGNRREDNKEAFAVHLCNHNWRHNSRFRVLRHRIKSIFDKLIRGEEEVPL